jgi:hypothetical protein
VRVQGKEAAEELSKEPGSKDRFAEWCVSLFFFFFLFFIKDWNISLSFLWCSFFFREESS